MGNSKLPRDITGSDAVVRQFDYPLTDDVGQGPPIDKHAAQLVDTAVTCDTHSC